MKIVFLKKYLNWLIIIVVLLMIGISLLITKHDTRTLEQPSTELKTIVEQNENKNIEEKKSEKTEIKQLFVDVKGEVLHEGVYKVNQGERVLDAVNKAGGFTKQADKKNVNLAALLKDEMVVYIPKVGENSPPAMSEQTENGEKKVNINSANEEDLQTLPGIGTSKAAAIISYREEHGLFKTVEEIMNVSGIGKSTFENMQEYITVN